MCKDKKGPCLNNKFNPTYNIAHCIYVKHYLLTLCLEWTYQDSFFQKPYGTKIWTQDIMN